MLKLGKIPESAQLENMRKLLQQVMLEIDGLTPPNLSEPVAGAVLSKAALKMKLELLASLLQSDLGVAEIVLSELRTLFASTTTGRKCLTHAI